MHNKISACLIVKNEEKHLHRCLSSIKDVVDEIIVVDTGSNDESIAIAKQYTDLVYSIQWNNDFSYARNYSIQCASGNWILIMDADEEFIGTREDLETVIQESESFPYEIKIVSVVDSEIGEGEFISYMARLFPAKKYRFFGEIHEQLMHTKKDYTVFKRTDKVYFKHYGYITELNTQKIQRNIAILKKICNQKKDLVKNLFYLAAEYKKNHETENAINTFKEWFTYVSRDNSDISYGVYLYLMSLYEVNKYQEAIDSITPYLHRIIHHPSCLTALAYNHFMLEQFEKAYEYTQKACTILNDKEALKKVSMIHMHNALYDTQMLTGSCLYFLKQYEQSMNAFIDMYSHFPSALVAHKIIQSAIPINKLDIIEQYINILRTVLNDTSEETALLYANLLFNQGKIKESIIEFLKISNGKQYVEMLKNALFQKQRFNDLELVDNLIKEYEKNVA